LEGYHLSDYSSQDTISLHKEAGSQSSCVSSQALTCTLLSLSGSIGEYQRRQGKGAHLWNYIRTGRLIDFNLAKKLDSEWRQSWGWYYAKYGDSN